MPAASRRKCALGDHQPARHHAVGEDLARAVHVGQERLQRADPLRDAGLDVLPLGGGDDARDDVHRERPLDALQRERDALIEERAGQHVGAEPQLGAGERPQRGVQRLVAARGSAGVAEHLVPPGTGR